MLIQFNCTAVYGKVNAIIKTGTSNSLGSYESKSSIVNIQTGRLTLDLNDISGYSEMTASQASIILHTLTLGDIDLIYADAGSAKQDYQKLVAIMPAKNILNLEYGDVLKIQEELKERAPGRGGPKISLKRKLDQNNTQETTDERPEQVEGKSK